MYCASLLCTSTKFFFLKFRLPPLVLFFLSKVMSKKTITITYYSYYKITEPNIFMNFNECFHLLSLNIAITYYLYIA